jgi:hypothetical protein
MCISKHRRWLSRGHAQLHAAAQQDTPLLLLHCKHQAVTTAVRSYPGVSAACVAVSNHELLQSVMHITLHCVSCCSGTSKSSDSSSLLYSRFRAVAAAAHRLLQLFALACCTCDLASTPTAQSSWMTTSRQSLVPAHSCSVPQQQQQQHQQQQQQLDPTTRELLAGAGLN